MRITILWSALASYSVAFFRALATSESCRLQLIYQKPEAEAPYGSFDLSFCDDLAEDSPAMREKLRERVSRFSPDCILMSGWTHPHFMRIARESRRRRIYVVATMDNQWRGSFKQYLGIATAHWFLKPAIDTFLVAGERQAQFARKLGYDQVLHGCYAAEAEKFASRLAVTSRPRAFLFIGRLIRVKNLHGLAEAYRRYRKRVTNPWTLIIAGTGPLSSAFNGVEGVEPLGFVRPSMLPEVMQRARCFVLPSLFEPWGVVIHEAASAGLPIIASYECGAVPALVRDGINGFVVSPDADSIAGGMLRVAESSDSELHAMSQASTTLANLWTPRKLATYFCRTLGDRVARNNRGPSLELASNALAR